MAAYCAKIAKNVEAIPCYKVIRFSVTNQVNYRAKMSFDGTLFVKDKLIFYQGHV
jgi:hypothetical protein